MTTPNLTFIGPDARNTIYIENAQGMRTPIFAVTAAKHSKPSLSVYRIHPNGHQEPFFTSSTSSLTGTSTINLIDRYNLIKIKASWESLQLRREFPGPIGKLSWFPSGSGSDQKLKDQNGTVLAKFKTKIDSGSGKEPRLEILVPCDDYLVDVIVATGLTVYKETVKEGEAD
ncbi:uncharacterized protein N0V89_003818 [Didymosphaeria variabile]|uniref:Uncharacterized protein n=1 Tax=Didymosphaeria variabile TaxID=1932322 RepID=A0A9W9CCW1_9PLEO|nr:uncharacterized protein N0V89_003818 [Didymosphaeria variabile]KAJ4355797.1 hypothetical protein N0V89_003818 [Didymosphaeria variabile]